DALERLEEVHLARQLVRAAVAPVRLENEGVRPDERTAAAVRVVQEVDLAERLVAAVEPGVEPPAVWAASVERFGNVEAVRLYRAVDLRDVAARRRPRLRHPRRLARGELLRALAAACEQRLRSSDLVDVEELAVLERVADGVVVDLHVRQQRRRLRVPAQAFD